MEECCKLVVVSQCLIFTVFKRLNLSRRSSWLKFTVIIQRDYKHPLISGDRVFQCGLLKEKGLDLSSDTRISERHTLLLVRASWAIDDFRSSPFQSLHSTVCSEGSPILDLDWVITRCAPDICWPWLRSPILQPVPFVAHLKSTYKKWHLGCSSQRKVYHYFSWSALNWGLEISTVREKLSGEVP
jgi:hypothetical protein